MSGSGEEPRREDEVRPQPDPPPASATEPRDPGGDPLVDVPAAPGPDAAPPRGPETPPGQAPAPPKPPPVELEVVEVRELNWEAIRAAATAPFGDERAERILRGMEDRLSAGWPLGLAFEEHADGPGDFALRIREEPDGEVWFLGDLHGDLLALEAALRVIDRGGGEESARIVFLGDLFDDGRHSPEVVLRVFELLLERPRGRVTVLAGNHDEALRFEEGRFTSSVIPSDFTDWLNQRPDHPWAWRLGKVIAAFFARAPRALFFPDGLFAAHGGIPHSDLHAELEESGDWNAPRVLQDFVWLRAHPRARRRIPNRTTRGSEFGREDFEAFCALATRLGRPVSRMVRGHDHLEERFGVFYQDHPVLTINAMSHRLPREIFGPYEREPVLARRVPGELPEVHRILIPPALIRDVYPEPPAGGVEDA